jgi:hypothetical protein
MQSMQKCKVGMVAGLVLNKVRGGGGWCLLFLLAVGQWPGTYVEQASKKTAQQDGLISPAKTATKATFKMATKKKPH